MQYSKQTATEDLINIAIIEFVL